jgi:hypothetical protein
MNNEQSHLLHADLFASLQVPEPERPAQLRIALHTPQPLAPWIRTKF